MRNGNGDGCIGMGNDGCIVARWVHGAWCMGMDRCLGMGMEVRGTDGFEEWREEEQARGGGFEEWREERPGHAWGSDGFDECRTRSGWRQAQPRSR